MPRTRLSTHGRGAGSALLPAAQTAESGNGSKGTGETLSASLLTTGTSAALLAAASGLALGVILLVAARSASRLITPDDPAIGMAKVLVANTLVMAVAVGSLFACYAWARFALTPFGIALVAGFLVAASVELFRFGGPATGAARRR